MEEITNFSQLPMGCKFCPTDKELLGFFLYKKITNALPPQYDAIIRECDLYGEVEPWEIWEVFRGEDNKDDDEEEEDLFLFTRLKKKSSNGSRINRKVGCGSGAWQGEDAAQKVPPGKSKEKLGFKKRFRYENKGSKHDGGWIMHEYSLDPSLLKSHSHQANDYVLCRIRKNVPVLGKKRKHQEVFVKKTRKRQEEQEEKQVIDAENDKAVDHQLVDPGDSELLTLALMTSNFWNYSDSETIALLMD